MENTVTVQRKPPSLNTTAAIQKKPPSLEALPEELHLQVLSYLDTCAPSITSFSQDPSPSISRSETTPLKSLSYVSHHWRRLTLPLLFKNIRAAVDEYVSLSSETVRMLRFLVENQLAQQVSSVVLTTDLVLPSPRSAEPDRSPWHWKAAGGGHFAFWTHLFSVLSPARLTIVAPPSTLACFAGLLLYYEDAWKFEIRYQSLEICWDSPPPTASPREIRSSLFPPTLGSTHHVRLHESSMLKSYDAYDHYYDSPPSILRSLILAHHFSPHLHLLSLSYHAVFPSATHIASALQPRLWATSANLARVQALTVQFAPDPESGILDALARAGNANLVDCWVQVDRSYGAVERLVAGMGEEAGLQEARSLDCRFGDVAVEVGERFGRLEWKGWRGVGVGVWRRDGEKTGGVEG